MARPHETGLKVARKTLASGEVREYFYDRASGAFLGHDRDAARARVTRLEPARAHFAPGSMADLVSRYRQTTRYTSRLAPRTRALYSGYLDLIVREWGDLPARAMKPGHVEQIKTRFEATPRKANQILALLRILFGLAVKFEWVDANPAARPEMLPTPSRAAVWSPAQESAFLDAAPDRLRLAAGLLLYTVQRPADVLAMTIGQVAERDGRLWLTLRQQKTGELIAVPVHHRLEPLLRARLADPTGGVRQPKKGAPRPVPTLLVPSPTGLVWAYRNFSRAWDATLTRAEVAGVQRRDLRRTGVVRMAEAGAPVAAIAGLAGWRIDYCQRIVDTYLPRRAEVALRAVEAWEGGRVESVVIPMRRPGG